MTPAPTPNKTVKKTSPLATLLAYIQRQWHLLSIVARWMCLMLTKDNLRAYLRRHWRLLALLILYIFFRPIFEEKLASLLQFFDPSWGSAIVWLGVIVILIALVCTHSLGYEWYLFSQKYSKSFVAILFGLWTYYHFGGAKNYRVIEPYIPCIYYMDIFLVVCACLLIVRVRSYREERARQRALKVRMRQATINGVKEGYQVDQPIRSEDEDLLGRRGEAKSLSEKIFKTDTSKGAFTLGLTAPWGAGKTSFMLVMREYLTKKPSQEVIVMAFNPWMYRKAPNLTQVFFEELSRTLAPYNSDLASAFIRYVRSLLAQESNAWLQLVARLLPQESNEKSITEQYESLSQEICRLGRKIFIFIDDVDRLEREELVELFALVRNSSSFPCMSYILAYDKEYVASQLKGCFDQHTHRYMEKILQEEYALAQITPEQLEQALKMELEEIGYGALFAAIKESQILLSYHLPTLRAVKRICNTLSSCRRALEGNVAIFDWFIIELIRTQYPRLFDFLKANYERAFDSQGDKRLFKTTEEKKDEQGWAKKALPGHPKYGGLVYFSSYLSEHQEYFQIKDVGLVIELMMVLWGDTREVNPLQANHGDYIGRYFFGTLREIEIDETEFRAHIVLPFEEIKPYIRDKALRQFTDLVRKVRREPIESQEQARKLLQVLFYLYSDLNRGFGWEEITYKVDALSKYLIGEDLKSELREIFEHPDTRVGVLRYLSGLTNEKDNIKIPFTQDELEVIKEDLFVAYVEGATPIDPISCYRLWHQAQTYIWIDSEGERLPQSQPAVCHPRMDKEMKWIIEENIESLIPYMVARWMYDKTRYCLLCPYPIWSLNEGEENPAIGYFPKFIFSLEGGKSPIIREFQAFLQKRLELGDELISFDFKCITPMKVV